MRRARPSRLPSPRPTRCRHASARSTSRTARRSKATLEKVYDNLDFTYAFRAFMDNMRGVSIHALRKGMMSLGMKDNEVDRLRTIDGCQVAVPDGQRRHDLCHGLPRSQQGAGGAGDATEVSRRGAGRLVPLGDRLGRARARPRGRAASILIVGPDYTGPLPEGGFFVARARTHTIAVVWSIVSRKQRSQAGGRRDQEVHQGLSIRSRWCRHSHRRVLGRQGQTRQSHTTTRHGLPRMEAAR